MIATNVIIRLHGPRHDSIILMLPVIVKIAITAGLPRANLSAGIPSPRVIAANVTAPKHLPSMADPFMLKRLGKRVRIQVVTVSVVAVDRKMWPTLIQIFSVTIVIIKEVFGPWSGWIMARLSVHAAVVTVQAERVRRCLAATTPLP